MGFTKLTNPKPTTAAAPINGVAVLCRTMTARRKKGFAEGPPPRFVQMRVGGGIARKAGFSGKEHRANVLIGDGLERRRCGIAIDDAKGEFKVRKLPNGDFQLTVSERASGGMLKFDAPRFAAEAELVPLAAGQPPCIMFDLSTEIRAA